MVIVESRGIGPKVYAGEILRRRNALEKFPLDVVAKTRQAHDGLFDDVADRRTREGANRPRSSVLGPRFATTRFNRGPRTEDRGHEVRFLHRLRYVVGSDERDGLRRLSP